MSEISLAAAKQNTARSASEVFGPLEADAIATLHFWTSHGGRMLDGKAALDAAKYILDKLHGRTPDLSQGQEPLWMTVVRKAVHVDGAPVENMPDVQSAMSNGTRASGDIEEITFEFVWPEAS
jgi:hypothetical protein